MSEEDELWSYSYEGVRCHRHMSRQARAAQFAPFAALEGYEEAVAEASRYTEDKPELSEEQRQELDQIWQSLCRRGLEHSRLRITYFQEDLRKYGGTWRTAIVQCKKLDRIKRCLITRDGQKIPLDCICQVGLA
ncbi:hypothetical protein [uncultured Megasphaera sp.]|uniref:hypothetical protein n=1 Tax=uncultured Megasphaera sp. TaxID=165188 RepID=UPI002628C4B8|nr:hypothetical protein [uncultured Megasphaera sp.]